MRSSRSTWLNSEPLVSSVPRIVFPRQTTWKGDHVLYPASRGGFFSSLLGLSFRKEIIGLFASPVDENPTVVMMEAAFADLDLDWRYITMKVKPRLLKHAVRGAVAMGLRGFNCTIPHKQAVIPFVDELAPSASLMGAVNCVVIQDDGRLIGYNTDGQGLVAILSKQRQLAGQRVSIVGAGGAARAIAVELALAGVRQFDVLNGSVAQMA